MKYYWLAVVILFGLLVCAGMYEDSLKHEKEMKRLEIEELRVKDSIQLLHRN